MKNKLLLPPAALSSWRQSRAPDYGDKIPNLNLLQLRS